MKKYTNLSKMISDLYEIEETNESSKMISTMSNMYLGEFRQGNILLNLDPYSEEYYLYVVEIYKSLSGIQEYNASVNELAPYLNLEISIQSPSPFNIPNSEMVGEFISSWGWILKALNVQKGQKVLEYGAGEGQLAILLARMGVDVYVIDIENKYLDSIKKQCDLLNIKINLMQGIFGDTFDGISFDRILFFEAFHHSLNHQDILPKLKSYLQSDGYIVFSGEPILGKESPLLDFIPYPWGPRLDGLSIRACNKFGWCELGFQQGYFVESLMRYGYLVKFLPCPVTSRGDCYLAYPNFGEIDVCNPYIFMNVNGDSGWNTAEDTHRWTKDEAIIPLPEYMVKNGGRIEITVKNFFGMEKYVKLIAGIVEREIIITPNIEVTLSITFPSAKYLIIKSDITIPSEINPESRDSRSLGIAVKKIKLFPN